MPATRAALPELRNAFTRPGVEQRARYLGCLVRRGQGAVCRDHDSGWVSGIGVTGCCTTARCATRVAVSAETSLALLPAPVRATAVVTGNPVRPEVLRGRADAAVSALGWLELDRALPVVYVTGGAQGPAQVNGLVTEILPWLLPRANVIHQCGAASADAMKEHAALLPRRSRAVTWSWALSAPSCRTCWRWRRSGLWSPQPPPPSRTTSPRADRPALGRNALRYWD